MSDAPIYNDAIVKKFVIATVFWGIVAFLVGVFIASELTWPELNLGLSFTNFGRLRPVHTSAAIFAFGGEAMANFVFWGYQFFIVMVALSYVMGFSQTPSRNRSAPCTRTTSSACWAACYSSVGC